MVLPKLLPFAPGETTGSNAGKPLFFEWLSIDTAILIPYKCDAKCFVSLRSLAEWRLLCPFFRRWHQQLTSIFTPQEECHETRN